MNRTTDHPNPVLRALALHIHAMELARLSPAACRPLTRELQVLAYAEGFDTRRVWEFQQRARAEVRGHGPEHRATLQRFRAWAVGQEFQHDGVHYRIGHGHASDRLMGYATMPSSRDALDLDALDPAHRVLMRLYRRFEREMARDFSGDPECAACAFAREPREIDGVSRQPCPEHGGAS